MPTMTGLNDYLTAFLATAGISSALLLILRLLPDFARNLTVLLASLAAIEIFTSPFYVFGLVLGAGLVYYALFWLQWNPGKSFYCRLIGAALVGIVIAFFFWAGTLASLCGAIFLAIRLLMVTWSVGGGRPLPSDPLEFFVYAFFFPTFFIVPLQSLDGFRASQWKGVFRQFLRIVLGLAALFLLQFLDERFDHRHQGLRFVKDLALTDGAGSPVEDPGNPPQFVRTPE
jgi:hypothetical protein